VVRSIPLGGNRALIGASYPLNPLTNAYNPIFILFAKPASKVSLKVLDIGANGIVLDAFDPSGRWVCSRSEVNTTDDPARVFSFSGCGPALGRIDIRQVTLMKTSDGYAIDDIKFTQ
jgi:hypothetical protein